MSPEDKKKLDKMFALPKKYRLARDWHLYLIVPAAVLLFADIFFLRPEHFNTFDFVSSGVLALLLTIEFYCRVFLSKTALGYIFAPILAAICLAGDAILYLPA